MSAQTPNAVTLLSEWTAFLDAKDISEAAANAAKNCVIDGLGCMIGGIGMASSRMALDMFLNCGSGRQVSVPGSTERLGLLDAAWLGAHTMNVLDFNDCSRIGGFSNPGATVIPAALALAEARGSSGHAFLNAVIAGYEVSLRIGRATTASIVRSSQVAGSSTWQIFGSTAAAANLLGLGPQQVRSAFGIAAMQAPVPGIRKALEGVRPYGWIKNSYGIAAQAGLQAALLAESGFHGHQDVFDGPHGFWAMAGSDRHDDSGYGGLGAEWLISLTEFKPYACCGWSHTMIEGLETLRSGLPSEQIEQVDVHGFSNFHESLGGELPASIIDAQFNARYLAALELLDRSPANGLREKDLSDPEVGEMARRITLHRAPQYDVPHNCNMSAPVRIVMKLASGEVRDIYIEEPSTSILRGGFQRRQICEKFLGIAEPVIGEERAEEMLKCVLQIETFDIKTLTDLLTPAAPDRSDAGIAADAPRTTTIRSVAKESHG